MKKTILLALLLCLTSCYTQKWASKKISKVAYEQPIVLIQECLTRFPSKDSIYEKIEYIQGATIITHDSVTIDCDSVIKALNSKTPSTSSIGKLIKVPCPPSTHQIDTVFKEKVTTEQDAVKIFIIGKCLQSIQNHYKKILRSFPFLMYYQILQMY